VTPEPNAKGRLIESCPSGKHLFLAYNSPFIPGKTLQPDKWTDGVLESWGALIGQTHRLTQDYPVFDGVINPESGKKTLNWNEEINSFIDWCSDDDVKEVWFSLRESVAKLPATRQMCGMVQNDPHMENIMIGNGNINNNNNKINNINYNEININNKNYNDVNYNNINVNINNNNQTLYLIDFDVSNCHFFACDIAVAMQSILFTLAGGMERPLEDKEALLRFASHMLKGYRTQCGLPAESLEAIELFISYRRALLFTVMQDWLKTKPELYESWKRRTIEQPPIMGLILDELYVD
jgi:Ser/Thr protein kinase RdoA (MazF antagonist)